VNKENALALLPVWEQGILSRVKKNNDALQEKAKRSIFAAAKERCPMV
jgi:hypothetical protein